MMLKTQLYYIGLHRLGDKVFPQENSLVCVDSSIVEEHVKRLVEDRDTYLKVNFPIYSVHSAELKKFYPAYPYTYQLPRTENEIVNRRDSSKLVLQVDEVITYDDSTRIDFKLIISGMYTFQNDIQTEDQFIIVNEDDIECVEPVALLTDYIFTKPEDFDQSSMFGYFSPKHSSFKTFKQSDYVFSRENLNYIAGTGMKEYSPIMVTMQSDQQDSVNNNEEFEITSVVENDDQTEILYDFNILVDSNDSLYLNPLSTFAKKLYNSVLTSFSYLNNGQEIDDELKTLISSKFAYHLQSSEIEVNFYEDDQRIQ